MSRNIVYHPKAVKTIERLDSKYQVRVKQTIELLAQQKIPFYQIKSFSGAEHYFRVKIGKVRIIYESLDGRIYIWKVGYRRDVYRK